MSECTSIHVCVYILWTDGKLLQITSGLNQNLLQRCCGSSRYTPEILFSKHLVQIIDFTNSMNCSKKCYTLGEYYSLFYMCGGVTYLSLNRVST